MGSSAGQAVSVRRGPRRRGRWPGTARAARGQAPDAGPRDPALRFMLCHHRLEVLDHFRARGPALSWWPEPLRFRSWPWTRGQAVEAVATWEAAGQTELGAGKACGCLSLIATY